MNTIDTKNYFKHAKSWADDRFGQVEQSRQRYKTAFTLAMGLNVATMAVIGTLAHYQTVVPMLVHHYENGVTTVEPVTHVNAPMNRAQVESDIARYIEHREAYDASSYRAQFQLINLLSNSSVAKEYITEQNKPTSPVKILAHGMKREVHIYSINFLDSTLWNDKDLHKDHHPLAEVVFSLLDTDKSSGKSTVEHYNAIISWRYTSPPDSPEIRWQNWDGFEVTRYSKQPRVTEHSA